MGKKLAKKKAPPAKKPVKKAAVPSAKKPAGGKKVAPKKAVVKKPAAKPVAAKAAAKAAPAKVAPAKPAKKVAGPAIKKVKKEGAPKRVRTPKVVRLKAFWGVVNQSLRRIATFEYNERKQADKKAEELSKSAKSPHFVILVKEEIVG